MLARRLLELVRAGHGEEALAVGVTLAEHVLAAEPTACKASAG